MRKREASGDRWELRYLVDHAKQKNPGQDAHGWHEQHVAAGCQIGRVLPVNDHYAALGVASSASATAIKKAFRQQAALLHPDRNPAANAAQRFRAVQEAYEVLGEPSRREAYDNNRKRNLLDDPLQTARDIWLQYFEGLEPARK